MNHFILDVLEKIYSKIEMKVNKTIHFLRPDNVLKELKVLLTPTISGKSE